jgi:phosphatidylinositol-3-phosphatase
VNEPNRDRARAWAKVGVPAAAVVVLLIAGFAGAIPGIQGSSPGGSSAPVATNPPAAATASNATGPFPTPIRHVFLILMENEQTGVIYNQQPFQTQLANTYAWGGDANNPPHVGYYAACHPSAPNYLALSSGQTLQCNSDNYNTYAVNNLGNELQVANKSWVAYDESATVPCQTYDSGLFVVRHDPFPFYSDLEPNVTGGPCDTHVLPIANLTQDYPYNATPPEFTYVAPNILNDAHSSSAAVGDLFLSEFVPKLIAEPWFSSTVIFITYDEAYTAAGLENFTGYDGLWGGPVFTVAVSPYSLAVGALHINSTHYDLLSTIEWLLGLPGTGTGHDMTAEFPVLTGLFQPSVFGPGAQMGGTDLIGVSLPKYDLAGDDFGFADLENTNLAGADLAGANLSHADLAGADLSRADLRGANLQFADLDGANLRGADLRGAEMYTAELYGAILTGLGPSELTNFDGAGLTLADFQDAVCGTPNYIVAHGATLIDTLYVPRTCKPPL